MLFDWRGFKVLSCSHKLLPLPWFWRVSRGFITREPSLPQNPATSKRLSASVSSPRLRTGILDLCVQKQPAGLNSVNAENSSIELSERAQLELTFFGNTFVELCNRLDAVRALAAAFEGQNA